MSDSAVVDAAALVRAALGPAGAVASPGVPGREVVAWGDGGVLAGLVMLEALARQVDAWRVALVVEVDERSSRSRGPQGLAASHGCRNARELVRRVTGSAQSSVSRWLRLGRATRESTGLGGQVLPARFAHVAAAVAQGRITFDAALSIVDTLSPVRAAAGDVAVGLAEGELVGACTAVEPGGVPPLDADSVRIQAATWAAFLDQDGTAPSETDLAHRSLRLGGIYRGLVRIKGLLLPEVAAALSAFADACTNPRTPDIPGPRTPPPAGGDSGPDAPDDATSDVQHADHDTIGGIGAIGAIDGIDGLGGLGGLEWPAGADGDNFGGELDGDDDDLGSGADDPPVVAGDIPADPRTRPQLLHDILAMALGAAARVADQSSLAGNSPTVVVAVRQSDLEARRGTGATLVGGGFDGPLPLSMDATVQLACSGAVQRIALDDLGAIVGLWSPERCFTGQQRRAIALRDGGCIIPGCPVPPGWCEVHHITTHKDDPNGTHTSNGCLLCWYHHRTINTSGWDIRIHNAIPEVRPPAWLRALTRAGPTNPSNTNTNANTNDSDTDDGWRPATGSPTRMLDTLNNHDLHALTRLTS